MFGFKKKNQFATIDAQITKLAEIGISLKPDRTIDEMLFSFGRETRESEDWSTLLATMGGEVEEAPWGRRFSDDLWYYDAECIDDDGTYIAIAEQIQILAAGALDIRNIKDSVDIEQGVAWLEFELNGSTQHVDVAIDNDWMDPEVVDLFARLIRATGTSRQLAIAGMGQFGLMICQPLNTIAALNKLTGLRFVS